MTLGGGGGSPKTIQTVSHPIASTLEIVYTCPVDTLALIKPMLHVNSGGGDAGNLNFAIRVFNPVTGAPMDYNYTFGATSGIFPVPTEIGTGGFGSGNGNMSADADRFTQVETLVFDATGGVSSRSFGGCEFKLYPGEQFKLTGGSVGGKIKYGLIEYGITT